jgi:protease II
MIPHYFGGNIEEAKKYDPCYAVRACKKMPNGLIDFGTHDEYMQWLQPQELINALGESGHFGNVQWRW